VPTPPLFDRNYHHQVEQNVAIKMKKANDKKLEKQIMPHQKVINDRLSGIETNLMQLINA